MAITLARGASTTVAEPAVKRIANLSYHCGLIVEGVHYREDETYRELGVVNVGHVERQLANMLREIQHAPEWQETPDLARQLRLHFDPVKHALSYLALFLTRESVENDEVQTAIIFAAHLYSELPKLVRDYGYEEQARTT